MRRLAFIALLGLAACVTPSIPIPPPDPANADFTITTQDGTSVATFSYPADGNYVGATYYLFDHNTGGGVFHIANPDGSIGGLALPATAGDQVVITIEGNEQTVSRCVVLREGPQDPNTYCAF
ncbi:MAG: hypothetical protein ABJE66_23950 [Deltaproteobacteria bacterium]